MGTVATPINIAGENAPPVAPPPKVILPYWLEGSAPRAIHCLICASLGIDCRDKAPAGLNKAGYKGRASLACAHYHRTKAQYNVMPEIVGLVYTAWTRSAGVDTAVVHVDLVTGIKAWRGLKSLDGRGLVPLPVTSTLILLYERVLANFALAGQPTPAA
ncbi:hypothetical protein EG327_011694 [Venturia inaequalis]|uniref:Uncharacterized protein n=1 Tax=Venturia inaequalis TaxID=5025 RepID=A0A8H3UC76_VENIN|nr:hypothetical protein EG327_011694 [Venturia inaequalis]